MIKQANYLQSPKQLAAPKERVLSAMPPVKSLVVKSGSVFAPSAYSAEFGPLPGLYVRPSGMPAFTMPALEVDPKYKNKRASTFAVSQYSGALGGAPHKYQSGVPPLTIPPLETAKTSADEAINRQLLRTDDLDDQARAQKHRLMATGAAGALPFAGMIGQKKIIHDPMQGAKGKKYRTMQDLSRAARTGDVILTTKPEGSFFKNLIAPISGSEFYHAQPVVGQRAGSGLSYDTGHAINELEDVGTKRQQVKELRKNAPSVAKSVRGNYPDVMLLRPKKQLTARQAKVYQDEALLRSAGIYDTPKAISSWVKEVMVPKIHGVTDRGPQTICEGNICSTAPAMAMHKATGTEVVPGKRAQDVFPSDYLRSENYELVGHRLQNASRYARKGKLNRVLTPIATRGAMGATLAGTTYGVSGDPAIGGSVAGALGASAVANAAAKSKWGLDSAKHLPGIGDAASLLTTEDAGGQALMKRRLLTRRLPVVAGGAALGYLGTKKLREKALEFRARKKQAALKAASIMTPLGQLRKAQAVGAPGVPAAPGPSIAQQSKPVGFGVPMSGAVGAGAIGGGSKTLGV